MTAVVLDASAAAVYVVLARHLGAPVLTGDRKMARAPNLGVQFLDIS